MTNASIDEYFNAAAAVIDRHFPLPPPPPQRLRPLQISHRRSSPGAGCRQAAFSCKRRRRRLLLAPPALQASRTPLVIASGKAVWLGVVLVAVVAAATTLQAIVVHQVSFKALAAGNASVVRAANDFAFVDERVELTCQVLMTDSEERIRQVLWSKDGKNIVRWTKERARLEVLSIDFKGKIDESSTELRILVRNLTLSMHGSYNCLVRTDLNTSDADTGRLVSVVARNECSTARSLRLTSSSSSSSGDDYRNNECRASISLDCRHMFPKPSPACGLFDARSRKLLTALLVDIGADANGTFRARYANSIALAAPSHRSSPLADGAEYQLGASLASFAAAGRLEFRCDLSVPSTSFKQSFVGRVFEFGNNGDACFEPPLDFVKSLRTNYTQFAASQIRKSPNKQLQLNSPALLDEFEMLAASKLKYEFVQPTKKAFASQQQQQQQFNCLNKPKVGSRVRLLCEHSTSQLSGASSPQQQLRGAQFLECMPGGKWALVDTPSLVLEANGSFKELHGTALASAKTSFPTLSDDSSAVEFAPYATLVSSSGDTPSSSSPTQEAALGAMALDVDESVKQLARLLPVCVSTRKRVVSNERIVNKRPPPPPHAPFDETTARIAAANAASSATATATKTSVSVLNGFAIILATTATATALLTLNSLSLLY